MQYKEHKSKTGSRQISSEDWTSLRAKESSKKQAIA
jgi:hypothetical protein